MLIIKSLFEIYFKMLEYVFHSMPYKVKILSHIIPIHFYIWYYLLRVLTSWPLPVQPVKFFPLPGPLARMWEMTKPPDSYPSALIPGPVRPWCAGRSLEWPPRRPGTSAYSRDIASGGCSRWIDPRRDPWRGSPSAGPRIWPWARWRSAVYAASTPWRPVGRWADSCLETRLRECFSAVSMGF